MIQDTFSIFFMVTGTFFMVLASIGLLRLPDLYTRLHALTKGTTLGLVCLLLASAVSLASWEITLKVVCAIFFHFLTNPVGAHMITRAAYYHLKVKFWENTFAEEWKEHQL